MNTTLNQTAEHIPSLLKVNIVPFLHSSPAIGKSSIARQIADKFNLKVIDLRLTELDPSDLNGLPTFVDGYSKFLPFDTFPVSTTKLPKGYKGWLLLLDEFNSASYSVQAAAYKLILDRQVGQHKLNDKVAIIACGNLETDNAIVNTMSSALISRFAHFYIEINNKEWLEWAAKNGIDSRITSYLGFKPNHLYTFNPDVTEPYASPRTWEMLSKVIWDKEDMSLALLASLIGEGVSREFINYIKLYKELPNYDAIVVNPDKIKISDNLATQWALMSMVCSHIEADTTKEIVIFLKRLNMELQVCALREIKYRKSGLLRDTHISNWFKELSLEIF